MGCIATFFPGEAGGQTYALVLLHPQSVNTVPAHDPEKLLQVHHKFLTKLSADGKLLALGSLEEGGAMLWLNTPSAAEARSWITTHPFVEGGLWRAEIFTYEPLIGSFCQPPTPSTWAVYSVIHFVINLYKDTIRDFLVQWGKHEMFVQQLAQTGQLIARGILSVQEGDLLVVRGNVDMDVLQHDPAVQAGYLSVTRHLLRITQGSFCDD
jgi:uncharacterized protein YciI